MPQRRRQWRNRVVSGQPTPSLLLEDFRQERYPNLQLADIASHVVEFSRDYSGSKFIQRKLDDATPHRKDAIFREMRPHLESLILNTFGNFVVQKIFEVGDLEQRTEIIQIVSDNFMIICLHKYGCRVAQKAIEKSSTEQQRFILINLNRQDINNLSTNANGNHVIQKCFCFVPVFIKDFLFNLLLDDIYTLCFDLYGCRVIQCILIHGTEAHRSEIFRQVYATPLLVIQDRYGNYVVQHILMYCEEKQKYQLADFIIKNLIFLSQQKYSSNVVEKCMSMATERQQDFAMLAIYTRNPEEIKRFCVDPFANYVVQRLIAKVNIEQVKIMHEKLEPLFDRLNRVVCGRKIIELMNERIAKSKLLNNPLGTSKLINDPFGKLQLMNGFIGKSP